MELVGGNRGWQASMLLPSLRRRSNPVVQVNRSKETNRGAMDEINDFFARAGISSFISLTHTQTGLGAVSVVNQRRGALPPVHDPPWQGCRVVMTRTVVSVLECMSRAATTPRVSAETTA